MLFRSGTLITTAWDSSVVATISNGGTLNATGDINIFHGNLDLNHGTVNAANLQIYGKKLLPATDPFDIGDTSASLTGEGQINANVDNFGGIVAPGHSAGILNIVGNYTQHTNTGAGEQNAALGIGLGGTNNSEPFNPQFDQLLIDGLATLGLRFYHISDLSRF